MRIGDRAPERPLTGHGERDHREGAQPEGGLFAVDAYALTLGLAAASPRRGFGEAGEAAAAVSVKGVPARYPSGDPLCDARSGALAAGGLGIASLPRFVSAGFAGGKLLCARAATLVT